MSFSLWKILKATFFLQNALSWFATKSPPVFEHNYGKYLAIKKAFYLTALEQLEGDYLEFGVFTGSSFVLALRAHRQTKYLTHKKVQFWGFDSFSGFGEIDSNDKHPFYFDGMFNIDAQKVKKNIYKHASSEKVNLIEGFFEETLKNKTPRDMGISKGRIIFIDCDLKKPAETVFKFIAPIIQQGTILILDDYFSYYGDINKGIAGAYEAFKKVYPHMLWRRIYDYGYGGSAFICCSTDGPAHS